MFLCANTFTDFIIIKRIDFWAVECHFHTHFALPFPIQLTITHNGTQQLTTKNETNIVCSHYNFESISERENNSIWKRKKSIGIFLFHVCVYVIVRKDECFGDMYPQRLCVLKYESILCIASEVHILSKQISAFMCLYNISPQSKENHQFSLYKLRSFFLVRCCYWQQWHPLFLLCRVVSCFFVVFIACQ